MKKFYVHAVVQGNKYVGTFEAEDAEQAKAKAWKSAGTGVSFCHRCSPQCEDPECSELIVEEAEDDAEVDNGDAND